MINDHDELHPFTGARTMVEPPIDSNAFEPKQWNTDGSSGMGTGIFVSLNSDFVAAGVVLGDPVFIISGTPAIAIATTVGGGVTPTDFQINWMADQNYSNMLFKVGEAALHSFFSLIEIVRTRSVSAYTVNYARAWFSARFRDFNRDETGDIYCIDPEEEKKLGGKNRINGHLFERPILP